MLQIKTSDYSQSGLCSSNVCQVAVVLSGTANSLDSRSTSICRITTHDWLRAEESSDHGGVQACPWYHQHAWGIFLQTYLLIGLKWESASVQLLRQSDLTSLLYLLRSWGSTCIYFYTLVTPKGGNVVPYTYSDLLPTGEPIEDLAEKISLIVHGLETEQGCMIEMAEVLIWQPRQLQAGPGQARHIEKSKTPRWVGLFSN